MIRQIAFLGAVFLFALNTQAQVLKGLVKGKQEDGKIEALPGATVSMADRSAVVLTDANGAFEIKASAGSNVLIASFVGFENDTIVVSDTSKAINFVLQNGSLLKEVVIEEQVDATSRSKMNVLNMQLVTEKELGKAACCNLSESFETNPSVDVAMNDGVTGLKQIQMLGLAGVYTQITTENIPNTRGLSSYYGLIYEPGTWISSMQVSKGVGSVANGYESISGQINIEERKPFDKEKTFVNGYTSSMGRNELNLIKATNVAERVSTALFLHGNYTGMITDQNVDGFRDMPTGNQVNVYNRWKFANKKGLEGQVGARYIKDDRIGGEMMFSEGKPNNLYGTKVKTEKKELYSKTGYILNDAATKSIGWINSFQSFNVNGIYGLINYTGLQNTYYSNLLYQTESSEKTHKFRGGASFMFDDLKETYQSLAFNRKEIVPGAFGEYTYNHEEIFLAVAGLRVDYHNVFGAFITPRLHLKYIINENLIARLAFGRGQRTANIFAENSVLLVSNRNLIINGNGSNYAYGLNPEVAWNNGANLNYDFKLNHHKGNINVDAYYTYFTKQVVVDLDQSARNAVVYNLDGKSYSTSIQTEITYEPLKRLNIKMAYRYLDVKTAYHNVLLEKPLIAKHRTFINADYTTRSKWKFDATAQYVDTKRIPFTGDNIEVYQLKERSKGYALFNAQITKVLNKWEAYLGVENIANYIQPNLILGSDRPFSQYFDASMAWGPGIGRLFYIGFRYKI